eukprot:TRINITY_DN76508_c0_g1_i1.p1 TRINITY_DN76508_c0_g1~~TRINITY_DN76508_c0_g1_i1.p1  ORF type:complete len:679 (+),score=111.90 TRINITY_DN76508_c0_g1_i1:54-2039(+)
MAWESEVDEVPDVYEDSAVNDDTPRTSVPQSYRDGPPQEHLPEAAGIPAAVQRILELRRDEDRRLDDQALGQALGRDFSPVGGAFVYPHIPPLGPPLGRATGEEWTPQLREFSEEVRRLRDEAARRGPEGLEVKTYFDLQSYNLDSFAEKKQKQPSSLLLMYMFYSRIFEKLVGKQKGVEVPLFAPVDFGDRLLGFRAILEWSKDFKVTPSRVPRRELERIFVTCHAGSQPSEEKFASKITYSEFVLLVALCGNTGEPMDRSRVDGSRVRETETRLDQVKRLAGFLCLANPKKVKLELHNAYRDVHFWKLSNGADFAKEARAAEMRSRPQYRVEALPIGDNDPSVAAARRYLDQFTWCHTEQLWEEFEVPCLDMGCFVLSGSTKRFRAQIRNLGMSLAKLTLQISSAGPLRLPWKDCMLGPGQSVDVIVEVLPMECGEWRGELVASAAWTGSFGPGQADVRVPTYVRVLQPQKGTEDISSRLPLHAPRPFRPGSANRISIDPASLHSQQLRTPTPNKSGRPSSAASSARPPRPSSAGGNRPPSSRGCSTGVPSSRPLSCLGPASSRGNSASGAPCSLGQVGRQCSGLEAARKGYEKDTYGHMLGRPRSAPLASGPPSSMPGSARARPSSAFGHRPQSANSGGGTPRGFHVGARRRAGSHPV